MEDFVVTIEGSGRHLHLSKEHLDLLFGEGFELEQKKWLSQPGEFASGSKVDLVGPKGTIKGVSVLGPVRKATQVELSFTDARTLGLTPPIRESGNVAGSAPVTVIGPNATLDLKEGVIIAKRHLHLDTETAEKQNIKDKQIVKVKTKGERAMIFDEVVARVSPNYRTFIHLDYDEINAAALFSDMDGIVIKD